MPGFDLPKLRARGRWRSSPSEFPNLSKGLLSASVGKAGANRPRDVKIVQSLLNMAAQHPAMGLETLKVDGLAGVKTIATISRFQMANFSAQDGLVSPDGPTVRVLAVAATAPGSQVSHISPPRIGGVLDDAADALAELLGGTTAKQDARIKSALAARQTAKVMTEKAITALQGVLTAKLVGSFHPVTSLVQKHFAPIGHENEVFALLPTMIERMTAALREVKNHIEYPLFFPIMGPGSNPNNVSESKSGGALQETLFPRRMILFGDLCDGPPILGNRPRFAATILHECWHLSVPANIQPSIAEEHYANNPAYAAYGALKRINQPPSYEYFAYELFDGTRNAKEFITDVNKELDRPPFVEKGGMIIPK